LHTGAPLQYVYGSAQGAPATLTASRDADQEGGKPDLELLLKSEPPERESAAKVVLELESTEEIGTETV
jgi:hypothetical protein